MAKGKTKSKKKKQFSKKKKILVYLLLLLGIAIFLYPVFSQLYYRVESNDQVADFAQGVEELDQEEIDRRMDLAHAYNASLNNQIEGDTYSDEMLQQGVNEYARMLEVNEKIGVVEIPSIDVKLPIYAGTNEAVLQKGAGHLEGTSLPVGEYDSNDRWYRYSNLRCSWYCINRNCIIHHEEK